MSNTHRALIAMVAVAAVSGTCLLVPVAATAAETAASTRAAADSAAMLPAGLVGAIERDLDISAEEFIAQGEAAADAAAIQPALEEVGVTPDQVWLDGTTIMVQSGDAAVSEVIRDLGAQPTAEAPPAPEVDLSRPTTSYEDLQGGTGWTYNTAAGGVVCSLGFNGFDDAGARVVATAGHCASSASTTTATTTRRLNQTAMNTNGTRGSDIGPLRNGSVEFGGGQDLALIDVTNTALVAQPQVSTWNGSSVPVRGMVAATVGAPICKSGRTTGWTCGTVLAVNYTQQIVGGQTVNSVATDACMYRGDSGGAALIGNYAAGINSSGSWSDASCTDSNAFSAVYPITGHTDSVTGQQPGWEPRVLIDTPTITSAGGTPATITGKLTNAAPGTKIYLYVDGSTTPAASATVAADGTWSIAPSGLTAGTHAFTVVAGYGDWNRSASAAGTIVIPGATAAPVGERQFILAPALISGARGQVLALDGGDLSAYTLRSGRLDAGAPVTSGLEGHTIYGPGNWGGTSANDVVSVDAQGFMFLHEGDGQGGVKPPRQIGNGWSGYRVIPAGDLTGDKNADLLAIDTAGYLYLYRGDGKGGFMYPYPRVGNGWQGYDLYAAGDVTRDGNADILSVDSRGDLWMYGGVGDGTFLTRKQAGNGWNTYTLAAGADIDSADAYGTNDIVGRDDASGQLYLYSGIGGGRFGNRQLIAQNW